MPKMPNIPGKNLCTKCTNNNFCTKMMGICMFWKKKPSSKKNNENKDSDNRTDKN